MKQKNKNKKIKFTPHTALLSFNIGYFNRDKNSVIPITSMSQNRILLLLFFLEIFFDFEFVFQS